MMHCITVECGNSSGANVNPHYLRIENAEGYVLIAVYLFIYFLICMRVTRITQKVLN